MKYINDNSFVKLTILNFYVLYIIFMLPKQTLEENFSLMFGLNYYLVY